MKPIQELYLAHALRHPFAQRPDVRRRAMYLPVCGKCEAVAFRTGRTSDGWFIAKCPICGWEGVVTRTVKQHVREV